MKQLFLVLMLLMSYSKTAHAASTHSVEQYFDQLTAIGQFNGVVLVQSGEDVELLKAFNGESFPAWSRVDISDQFHIASIRKLFNQYVVYQVASEKYRHESLSSLMNDTRIDPRFTPELLLKHRSGLPRGEQFDFELERYDNAAVLDLIAKQDLLFEPGTDEHYSNFGHMLLDQANAVKFGQAPNHVLNTLIYEPLGLRQTESINRTERFDHLKGMYFVDGEVRSVPLTFYQRFPSGDVMSSAQDLNAFLRAVDVDAFGLDDGIIEHAGAKRGFRSYVYFDSTRDLSVVILSNHGEMPIAQTITDVKKLINNEAVELPQLINREQGPFNFDIANQLTGNYLLLVNQQPVSIVCRNNALFMVEYDASENPSETELFFETDQVLFFDPNSSDSVIVDGNEAPFDVFVTGYGNMRFELQQTEIGEPCGSVQDE